MSIPLINEVNKNDINTSIIAIKKNIERINTLLGLNNTEEIDTSIFATKEELEQAETDLAPVDEVTLNNMQSVTSNAVAEAIGEWEEVYRKDSGNYVLGIKNKLGTWLRIRLSGFTSGYISNATVLFTLPVSWRPTISIPNRCVIGVDTTTVRMNAGLDLEADGKVRIYFQGNTPLNGGETIIGLFGDVFMNIR